MGSRYLFSQGRPLELGGSETDSSTEVPRPQGDAMDPDRTILSSVAAQSSFLVPGSRVRAILLVLSVICHSHTCNLLEGRNKTGLHPNYL